MFWGHFILNSRFLNHQNVIGSYNDSKYKAEVCLFNEQNILIGHFILQSICFIIYRSVSIKFIYQVFIPKLQGEMK